MALAPAARGIEAVQDAVPEARLKLPELSDHWTWATTKLSDAVPARASGVEFVTKSSPPLVVIATLGFVLSRMMTVLMTEVFPAASVVRISTVLDPAAKGTDATVQEVVPEAAANTPLGAP